MIISTSIFQNKDTFITNAVAQPSISSNTPNAISILQQEVDEKEYAMLEMALGHEQTTELLAQFEQVTPGAAWTLKADALEKWKDLVNGKTYNGKRWRGLRYKIGTKDVSVIAFYVFFYYLKSDFSSYTTTGIQVAEAENSVRQTPNAKQVEAWNKFVQMYNGFRSGSRTQPSFFTNWNGRGIMWGNSADGNDVNLYEFLTDNSTVYDTSFFRFQSVINTYNV